MTVLVFGSGGPLDPILSNVPGVVVLSNQTADPRRPADCADLVEDVSPVAVLYLAGCRDADIAQRDPGFAQAVNAGTPQAIAATCARLDIPFVFQSSADVFDGRLAMAYVPSDTAEPITTLGQSLWSGEIGVQNTHARTAIVRSTWVFGQGDSQIFAEAGIMRDGSVWRVPQGIEAAPTPAFDLAAALLTMAATLVNQPEKAGIYHFAGDQNITLAGFAQRLALASDDAPSQIETAAARDLWPYPRVISHARLDCRTTQAVFGLGRPNWRAALRKTLVTQKSERFVA